MPESITDRPTKAHEYVFLLTKRERYYYDAEAIKEDALNAGKVVTLGEKSLSRGQATGAGIKASGNGLADAVTVAAGRNRRSVWTIATEPYPEAHFATFPEKLVEPCILAGTSERGACPTCGAPWGRQVERTAADGRTVLVASSDRHARDENGKPLSGDNRFDIGTRASFNSGGATVQSKAVGWSPACDCPAAEPVPCRVLDPFSGSGTTVAVAERLGRVGIGVELKESYIGLAKKRTIQAGLL